MNIPFPVKMCERSIMNVTGRVVRPCGVFVGLQLFAVATAVSVFAETTNTPSIANAPAVTESRPRTGETPPLPATGSRSFDESAFRIVAERNIFNANRSGGQVRLPSRRPAQVDSFTLVGTMAYEKGAFAFFNGSSSAYSKVVKASGVIAGYKVVDVLANAVKLEADGKILELPVGSAMRREDEGTWYLGDAVAGNSGSSYAANSENGHSSRSSRRESGSDNGPGAESAPKPTANTSSSNADQSEILKRLMERREKESQ